MLNLARNAAAEIGSVTGRGCYNQMPPLEAFCSQFLSLTTFRPLRWQMRLFEHFLNRSLPSGLDLPTGLGKTSVMAIWYLALKAGAPLPRRLVYVVDRRAVVDQATEEANKIKAWAEQPGHGKLPISTLRGQYADNRDWLEDPAAPAIIVGTVDMIGSRLLFEGYGVSRKMRPYHAGLLGADTLVVLDESHLVPPFERLLERIAQRDGFGPADGPDGKVIPPFRLLPLSATGRERAGEAFRLKDDDRGNDEIVRLRLSATKRLTFALADEESLADRLADEAWNLSTESVAPTRVLVYCNSRDVAGKVQQVLRKRSKGIAEFELLVGARRVKEREGARKRLEELGFISGNAALDKPAFVVATSAGEVGVDLDADHMVMDLVPFERMVQRLGRVNRLGSKDSQVVLVHGNRLEPKKNDAPTDEERRALIAWQAGQLLRKLPRHDDGSHDASPGALVALKEIHGEKVKAASTPDPLYPALSRPLVDAWSMTSLKEHTGRPEVQPWLRGWVEEKPQTTLVWRRHLPVRVQGGEATDKDINAFFAAAPPHLTEKLETESYRVHDWLKTRVKKLLDAAEKVRKAAGEETWDTEKPLGKDDIVAFLLDRENEPERRPSKLAELDKAAEDTQRFLSSIAGMTMILDARFGGLSEDGLLDDKSDTPVSAADGKNGWNNAEEERPPLVGFRVQHVKIKKEDDGEEPVATSRPRVSDENWHPVHAFDTKRDGENNAEEQLIIEKWRSENSDEDARSVAGRAQSLSEHQDWAAKRAKELVDRLGLEGEFANAVVIAARLHDEGKKAWRWQVAFHTKRDGRPYAKTGSRRSPNFDILGGYRHEFGSLFHLDSDNEFGVLSDEMKDLVRHLIAAHHGRARPVIGTDGCENLPPSALEAKSREVTLRFARLQKRFGPWGLAWLEALMRAADQQASRDLDEGKTPSG